MKESSWNDCIESNSARKVSCDIKRADSLTETAKEAIRKCKKLIDEIEGLK